MRFICNNCFNEFERDRTHKFCCLKCSHEFKFKQTVARLDNSNNFSIVEVRSIRKYLIFKFGNKCQICNREVWNTEKIPLVLDHIDGDSSNWLKGNIRMICPNCDAQLPTYKSRNRGKGRFSRRQRYNNGKSY